MTNKESVFQLLRPRHWISGADIEAAGGLRRLRELRAEGYEIKSRRTASGPHEYRLVSTTPRVTA